MSSSFPYHFTSHKSYIHNRTSSLSHHPNKDWETQSSLLTATDHHVDKTLPTFTSETKVKYAKFLVHKSPTSSKVLSPNSTFLTKNLQINPSSTSKSLVNLIQKTFSKNTSPRHDVTASDQTLKLPESTLETIKVPASRTRNLDASKTSSSFFVLKSDLNTTKDRDTAELPNTRPGSQMIRVFDSEYENKSVVKSPKKNRRSMIKSLYASTVNSPNNVTMNKPRDLYMNIRDKELSIELPFRYKSQEKIDPKNLCFALKKASYKKNSNIHQYLQKPQSPSVVSTTHENSTITPTEPPQNNQSQIRIYNQNFDSSAHLKKALASSSPLKYKKPVMKHRPMTTGYDFSPKRIRSSGVSPNSSTLKSSLVKTEDFQSRILLQDAFETPEQSFNKAIVLSGVDQTMTAQPLGPHQIKRKSRLVSRLEASSVENSERGKNLSNRNGKIIEDLKVETVDNSMEISRVPERIVEEESPGKAKRKSMHELVEKLAAALPFRKRQDEEYELASQNAMKGEHVKLSLQSSAMSHEYIFTKDEITKLADQVGDMEEEKEKLKHVPPKTLDLASAGTKTLNELEFSIIREEYLRKRTDPENVNYENIDKLVARLKFFAGLSKNVRMNLLKVASYKFYPSGATIYKEGDLCDQMYIIVRGSVNQRQKTKTSYGTTENLIVATLYDGRQFGEDNTYASSVRKTTILPTKNETIILNPKNHRKSTLTEVTSSIADGVDIRNKRKNSAQEPEEPKKKSIIDKLQNNYTGDYYSPRNPFRDQSKRECTMEAAEPCDMLCVSIDKFKDIFLTLVQRELEDRLNVLSGLPFLDKFDQFGLIPLANNLSLKTYRMGEVILAAGDPVEKFQIVSKGKCKLILGAMRKSNLQPPETLHGRMSTTHHFNTGAPDYSCKLTAMRTGVGKTLKKAANAKAKELEKKVNYENRTFAFDKMGVEDNHLLYMNHVQLDRLFQGDFFGGRALLTEIDMFEQPELNQMRHMLGKNSQLSVVADTATVEVFEIDKAGLDYLPDHLVKMLKKGLRIQTEFDDYDIKKIVKENQKMMDFQDKTTEDVFKYRKVMNGTTYKKF